LQALADQAAEAAVKAYQEAQVIDNAGVFKATAPKVIKKRGETEFSAFKSYLLTGDGGSSFKASNDTDMNVGTDADGGYAVPTGHYNGIIARREEGMLANKLGVRDIPGIGTTVNVPLDGANANAFVATGEASAFDRDAPTLGQKAMTLVKYTKKIELSYELLHDEDSKLMSFLNDYVGRAMAQTENALLLTEVASNGTELKEFASTGAIVAGEPEDILGNDALGYYMDDGGSIGWVMRNSVFYDIASITGSDRLYAETPAGSFKRSLLGYKVEPSNNAAAMAASAKSVYFGNWNFVGRREAPGFTVLRDPYSKAANGQVVLHYYFRTVYGVLQAGAIGYGVHATA
ncbi:MAG: phage major capsid protein, partial [Alteromonas sp.]|nr:phage major capsid protein [Alteromonas sp.]